MTSEAADIGLGDLAQQLDAELKEVRKTGEIAKILAATGPAIDRLEGAIAAAPGAPEDQRRAALQAAKQIAYNSAADIYPGWEAGTTRTHAELEDGMALARRCRDLTARLGLDKGQAGNAAWLIGAFHLACGTNADAAAEFRQAARHFAEEPEMRLMAEGYLAIAQLAACEAGAAAALQDRLDALTATGTEDAIFLRDQLVNARQIFAP
ncbi:MAG: hypothetical protein ACP5RC_04280 [Halothiobacillaceae bacterium]